MKRPQTPNRGAADAIREARTKIARMRKNGLRELELGIMAQKEGAYIALDYFYRWLGKWNERAAAKPGGLGRKKAAAKK